MSSYQLLPPLTATELRDLKDSIKQFGIQVPIVVDENGEVLDGHNRKQIADELGIDCPRVVRADLPEHEKRILAAELNIARRQLTDAQKVMVGRSIEPDVAERSKQRQVDLAGTRRDTSAADAAKVKPKRTEDEVARTVGIGSGDTYSRHKRIIEAIEAQPDGEQLIQHVASGDWDIPDAKKELEQRGVEWRKPANVTPMPSMLERLPESSVDALASGFYEAQLPSMVNQTVSLAAQHVRRGADAACKELAQIKWDDVSDEMRASESVMDSLKWMDAALGRFYDAIKNVRPSDQAIRRVK